jgi:hypothetical protein
MVAAFAVEREPCATPDCRRVAWRRGLCGTCYRLTTHPRIAALVAARAAEQDGAPRVQRRHRARGEPDDEPTLLEWTPATEASRHALAILDRILLAVENFNWAEEPHHPAPDLLVAAYRHVGGLGYTHRPPSGGELHEALLSLQEGYVRRFEPLDRPTRRIP